LKFSAVFEIGPSSVFGLPQAGMTVLPAGPGEYVGDSYDTWTGTKVGRGTLPVYRALDTAIQADLRVADAPTRFNDNFATIEIECDTAVTAYREATNRIDDLLRHLSLTQGRAFEWLPVSLVSEDGKVHPVPNLMQLAMVTTYDLGTLGRDLTSAAEYSVIDDERLNRAMDYYEQALLLFERRARIVQLLSHQHMQLISSIFLNLWKALTTIVGDPSRDRDHQRRHLELGLDHEFYTSRIRHLHDLRNEFDVAHYALDEAATQRVESEYGEAKKTVEEVLRRYRESLVSDGQGAPGA
jgi:hypothetical protein